MNHVLVVIGSGAIGVAIARRVGIGMHIVLADIKVSNLKESAQVLQSAGFDVSTIEADISVSESVERLVAHSISKGTLKGIVISAGVSPSQASIQRILQVDLVGTALLLERFYPYVTEGTCGIVIGSQSGHRLDPLSPTQNRMLATTPAGDLMTLDFLQPGQIRDTLHAYQISKRGNSLRVMSEAIRWGKKKARINVISPGIIITPLAKDELEGPRGEIYRSMIVNSPVGRAGTPDEVAAVAALLMGPEGSFITGSDLLMDGGTTAAYWFGDSRKG